MSRTSMKVFLFIFSLLSFSSCNDDEKKEKEDILSGRDLTESEINIAKNICIAFKSKRLNFRRLSSGDNEGDFNYQRYYQNCGGPLIDDGTLLVNYNVELRIFKPRSLRNYPRFISEINTDTEGILKEFCHEIIDLEKTKGLSNLVDSGDQKMIFGFYKNGNFVFEIDTYILENEKWNKIFIDYHEVVKTNDRKNGMVKTRIRKGFCPKNQYEIIKQILL